MSDTRQQFEEFEKSGKTLTAFAKEVGVPLSTLSKQFKDIRAREMEGLRAEHGLRMWRFSPKCLDLMEGIIQDEDQDMKLRKETAKDYMAIINKDNSPVNIVMGDQNVDARSVSFFGADPEAKARAVAMLEEPDE